MNDKMKNQFWNTDWLSHQPDWFQNQNQFMDAWSSFKQFMPNSTSAIHPMYEAMSSWWKSATPSLSGQHQDFYDKMMQQGKAFYFLGEQFSNLLEGMNATKKHSEEWQNVLNDHFETMQSMLEGANVNLQSAFTNGPFMTGGFDNEHFKMAEISSFFDKLLSMPGVGPDREVQAQIQKSIRLFSEYQQISSEYNAVMSKVGIEALQAMHMRILEMAEQGQEIHSLREIYDLWVDCNEQAYAKCVYTDEYSRLYGRLINALLALKQHNGQVMDQILTKFNIPTRKGMNTVLKRLQETKRAQVKSDAKLESMEQEIKLLRKLIEDDKKSSSAGNQRSVSTGKAGNKTVTKVSNKTGKKKTTKKKSKKKSKKSSSNSKIIIDI